MTYYPFTAVPSGLAAFFGPGTDGAIVLDGVTSYPGTFGTPAGSVYTQAKDVYCTSLTINPGVTVKPNFFRIFCTGTLTNNGSINIAGNNAVGATGGATQGSAVVGGGRAGGAGGTGVSGAGGNGGNATFGQPGGNGGAGTSGAAGTGGTTSFNDASLVTLSALTQPWAALEGGLWLNTNTQSMTPGAGGGGGGSDASSNAGGGGGGGGGAIIIFAQQVINNGSLVVAGGNGAAGAGGNAGGGGSGSGGLILIYTAVPVSGSGTTNIAPGTVGAGVGTGANGNAGGNGILIETVL